METRTSVGVLAALSVGAGGAVGHACGEVRRGVAGGADERGVAKGGDGDGADAADGGGWAYCDACRPACDVSRRVDGATGLVVGA